MRSFRRLTGTALAAIFCVGLASAQASLPTEKYVLRGLDYARVDGVDLKLDLHLPVKTDQPVPVILWLHPLGGGRGFCPVANLAKEGYAVASISYRLIGQVPFPAQIEDCKAAVRWLRAHAADYNLDAAHIGASGESAGGLLASLLGASGDDPALEGAVGGNPGFSSRVQAVVALCPPTDFSSMVTQRRERSFWVKFLTSGNPRAASYVFLRNQVVKKLLGGPLPERAELARQASPVAHVSPDDPPFLIFHGRNDPLIPLEQSEKFRAALVAVGVEARLEVIETSIHGFGRFPPDMMAQTRAFFTHHLRPEFAPLAAVGNQP